MLQTFCSENAQKLLIQDKCLPSLTFTTLWANSTDDKLMCFFFFFFFSYFSHKKQDLTFHACKVSPLHEMSNPVSLEKNKKNISKCRLLYFLLRVLRVKYVKCNFNKKNHFGTCHEYATKILPYDHSLSDKLRYCSSVDLIQNID